jgi:hypothetical protein
MSLVRAVRWWDQNAERLQKCLRIVDRVRAVSSGRTTWLAFVPGSLQMPAGSEQAIADRLFAAVQKP